MVYNIVMVLSKKMIYLFLIFNEMSRKAGSLIDSAAHGFHFFSVNIFITAKQKIKLNFISVHVAIKVHNH